VSCEVSSIQARPEIDGMIAFCPATVVSRTIVPMNWVSMIETPVSVSPALGLTL
jgi:hypothetical protein